MINPEDLQFIMVKKIVFVVLVCNLYDRKQQGAYRKVLD